MAGLSHDQDPRSVGIAVAAADDHRLIEAIDGAVVEGMGKKGTLAPGPHEAIEGHPLVLIEDGDKNPFARLKELLRQIAQMLGFLRLL
jgi:hypothetical protein